MSPHSFHHRDFCAVSDGHNGIPGDLVQLRLEVVFNDRRREESRKFSRTPVRDVVLRLGSTLR